MRTATRVAVIVSLGMKMRMTVQRSSKRGPLFRVSLITLVLMVIGLVAPAAGSAHHDWKNVHWAVEEVPFRLLVGNNVSGNFNGILNRVGRDWRRSDVVLPDVVGGHSNPSTCRPSKGRVEICNDDYGNTNWLGVAGVWVKHGHIKQGVVLLNDTYMGSGKYGRKVVKRHVLCQEIGHTFGLDHYNGHSCMDDRHGLFRGSFAKPSKHDFDELEHIYDHTHGNGTVDSVAVSDEVFTEAQLDLPLPSAQDRSIGSVIVDDFGDGGVRVTHIFWADQLEQ
jgi:hypothetical protein